MCDASITQLSYFWLLWRTAKPSHMLCSSWPFLYVSCLKACFCLFPAASETGCTWWASTVICQSRRGYRQTRRNIYKHTHTSQISSSMGQVYYKSVLPLIYLRHQSNVWHVRDIKNTHQQMNNGFTSTQSYMLEIVILRFVPDPLPQFPVSLIFVASVPFIS